jgi:hypothetical protein
MKRSSRVGQAAHALATAAIAVGLSGSFCPYRPELVAAQRPG